MTEINQGSIPEMQVSRASTAAILSLVFGIQTYVLCGFGIFFFIPAIICGHVARSAIKSSSGRLTGGGMAIAGLVMGYVYLAVIPLLIAIAVPNFIEARRRSQTRICIANMRNIDGAIQQMMIEVPREAEPITSSTQIPPAYLKNPQMIKCPCGTMPYPVTPTGTPRVQCPNVGEHPNHRL